MYIVIEIQKTESIATLVTAHETLAEAESKYFAILSAAAVSSVPVHSAVILDEKGRTKRQDAFTHEEEE